jgi:plastocyanin
MFTTPLIRRPTARACVLFLALLVHACSGSTTPSNPSPNPTPAPSPTATPTPTPTSAPGAATITIANNAVSPREVTIQRGGRVTFVNNDTRPHDMSSDPHPAHTDCQEMNQVGFLNPGQSRDTGAFNAARTCGFHDHNQDTVVALQGRIIIQ